MTFYAPETGLKASPEVARIGSGYFISLQTLLARYSINVIPVAANTEIPGSFWQEEEAGIIGNKLFVRDDTPLHSALHESCHIICMDSLRRNSLHTDAGGNDLEENCVCYLQILLSNHIERFSREKMFHDMDAWGYSFRFGSAKAWFENDCEEEIQQLKKWQLIDINKRPTFQLRA